MPALLLVLLLGAPLVGGVPGVRAADEIRVEKIPSPAPEESLTPFLAAAEDMLYLSWLQKTPGGHELVVSSTDGKTFARPSTIHASDRFFANWADFGSVLPFGKGKLAAHWLEKAASGTYEYDVVVSVSADGGKTWSLGEKPHRDGTLSEHGFVSLVKDGASGFALVWLDGRKFQKGSDDNEMSLLFTTHDGERFGDEVVLDGRVCECCQTAMVRTTDGYVVWYRDRSPADIRDIAYVRSAGGKWSEPRRLHADDWELHGCPVNGPQAASDGDHLAVAWLTGSKDDPRVQLLFSDDGGASFGEPFRVDDGGALGRVDVALVGGDAIVTWLAKAERAGEVRVRRLSPSGAVSEVVTIARTGAGRASGFPRLAALGPTVYVAWTESESRQGPSRVKLARLVLE